MSRPVFALAEVRRWGLVGKAARGALLGVALLTGCGGGSNTIVEPENPTPLPDPAQRTSAGAPAAGNGPSRALGN